MRLTEISARIGVPHETTKPTRMYALYDRYLAELADRAVTLLELGVYSGESTKVFASYFKNGKIIAVDIKDQGIDFSGYQNVVFARGDQRSAEELNAICSAHAPDGLDIIIDDASHYGSWSLASYSVLHRFLNPSGLYIIEDWATGYWDDWPDGSRFQQFSPEVTDGQMPKRLPSHDFGMVGFVKLLIDEVCSHGIRPTRAAPLTRPRKWESMHVHSELVVLRKNRGDETATGD
jgi:SAM-dependent methyltransferase